MSSTEEPTGASATTPPSSSTTHSPAPPGGVAGGGRGTIRQRVQRLLSQFNASNHKGQARIVHRLREMLPAAAPPLIDIAMGPVEENAPAAVRACGWLQLEDFDPQWLLHEEAPQLRRAAVWAGARKGTWQEPELISLLADPDSGVVRETLRALRRVGKAPVDRLLDLVESGDTSLRKDILEAFPQTLDEADWATLHARAANAPVATQLFLTRLMQTMPDDDDEETQRCLSVLTNAEKWNVRVLALKALAHRGAPLRDPRAVWRVIERKRSVLQERLMAWYALEACGPIERSKVLEALDGPDPSQRVAAARCLLRFDPGAALPHLVAVATAPTTPEHQPARSHARSVLTDLAGRNHTSEEGGWAAWLETNPQVSANDLRPPSNF